MSYYTNITAKLNSLGGHGGGGASVCVCVCVYLVCLTKGQLSSYLQCETNHLYFCSISPLSQKLLEIVSSAW